MFNAYLLGKQRTAVFGVLLCVINFVYRSQGCNKTTWHDLIA